MNCIPPVGTNAHHSGTESANSTSVANRATYLARGAGTSRTTAAATSGQTSSAVTTHRAYIG